MSHRYSSSTNASRVAEGSRGGLFTKPPVSEQPWSDTHSQRTFFGAFSVHSGKTSKFAKRLSSRISEPSTFYREATPPSSSQGEAPARPQEAYDGRHDHVAPPAPLPVATICGMRRRKFFIILWTVVAIIIIAVAVSVGVVFGLRKNRHTSGTGAFLGPPSSTSSATPASTSSGTATVTASSSASTRVIPCPEANNTRYLVPNSDKVFKRLCGIDYSGVNQAQDLGSVWTTTMQECMSRCIDFPGCTACGWGVIPEDPGSEHRCWLKSNLTSSNSVRAGWDFAILEQ